VDEREKDFARLKVEYDRLHAELRAIKEAEIDKRKEEWKQEILSENNPANMISIKKKLDDTKSFVRFGLKKMISRMS
jgi:hypothetical protein